MSRTEVNLYFRFDLPDKEHPALTICFAVWNTLRPKLEPAVQRAKAIREEAAREPLVASRRKILDDLYIEYLGQLKPSERYCAPPPGILRVLPAVWQVLDSGPDVDVTAQDFAPVVAQFPQHIKEHQEELKVRVGSTRIPT